MYDHYTGSDTIQMFSRVVLSNFWNVTHKINGLIIVHVYCS